ncbi:MAG: sulfatase-like hydrolase/transferase [Bacteroidetes bacterium]|nr:sulfatase-like hydrolase/transferase [Bacteroidota bacterium]
MIKSISIFLLLFPFASCIQNASPPPNLLIIHTDEHNFRTIGAYRNTMSEDQAFIWGKNTFVTTPNIDKLAEQGVMCTSYYASSPVCTPSRASFITGLYPIATGSPKNDLPLNDDVITFAEILQQNGYSTSYVGKWHLDGEAKPGFAPARKFGFEDNRYMYNRGHWKMFEETANGPSFIGDFDVKKNRYKYNIEDATEHSFSTDYLTDRTIEIIDRDKSKPFCVMLSLPDPHGPNTVRAPYDSMYTHFKFEEPHSMFAKPEQIPAWNARGKKPVNQLNQRAMAQYFGMVKCIDDNVGKLLRYLNEQGLDNNTIVVFTSDHGDLMGEHGKHNKGLPYETSAGIPFIIRYPGKIPVGKITHTAYTTADFAPTILSIMGIRKQLPDFHGMDTSSDFLVNGKEVSDNRIVYITNAASRWVAATNSHYKLVLSPSDEPWLFDLQKDPDELINFYKNPEYKEIAEQFKQELLHQMKLYDEPLKKEELIY